MTSSARTIRRPLLGRIAAAAAGSRSASRACSAARPERVQLGVEPRPGSPGLAREVEPVEGAAQVQPGTADQDGSRPRPAMSAIAARASAWYSATAADFADRPDVEQVVRHAVAFGRRQLRGADVHAAVELHRVGVDDLAVEPVGEGDGEVATCRSRSGRRPRARAAARPVASGSPQGG